MCPARNAARPSGWERIQRTSSTTVREPARPSRSSSRRRASSSAEMRIGMLQSSPGRRPAGTPIAATTVPVASHAGTRLHRPSGAPRRGLDSAVGIRLARMGGNVPGKLAGRNECERGRVNDRQPRCVRGRRAPHAPRHEAARPPGLRGHRAGARRRVRAAAHLAARRGRRRARRRDRAMDPQLDIALSFRLDALALLLALIVTGVGALVLLYCMHYFSDDEPALGRFAALLLAFAGRHVRPRHLRRRLPPVHVLGGDERALVPAHRPLHRPEGEPWCGTAGAHRHDVRRARDARRPRHARRRRAARARSPSSSRTRSRARRPSGASPSCSSVRSRRARSCRSTSGCPPRWPRPPR